MSGPRGGAAHEELESRCERLLGPVHSQRSFAECSAPVLDRILALAASSPGELRNYALVDKAMGSAASLRTAGTSSKERWLASVAIGFTRTVPRGCSPRFTELPDPVGNEPAVGEERSRFARVVQAYRRLGAASPKQEQVIRVLAFLTVNFFRRWGCSKLQPWESVQQVREWREALAELALHRHAWPELAVGDAVSLFVIENIPREVRLSLPAQENVDGMCFIHWVAYEAEDAGFVRALFEGQSEEACEEVLRLMDDDDFTPLEAAERGEIAGALLALVPRKVRVELVQLAEESGTLLAEDLVWAGHVLGSMAPDDRVELLLWHRWLYRIAPASAEDERQALFACRQIFGDLSGSARVRVLAQEDQDGDTPLTIFARKAPSGRPQVVALLLQLPELDRVRLLTWDDRADGKVRPMRPLLWRIMTAPVDSLRKLFARFSAENRERLLGVPGGRWNILQVWDSFGDGSEVILDVLRSLPADAQVRALLCPGACSNAGNAELPLHRLVAAELGLLRKLSQNWSCADRQQLLEAGGVTGRAAAVIWQP